MRICGKFNVAKGSGNVLMCGRIAGYKGRHRCACGCGLRWENLKRRKK